MGRNSVADCSYKVSSMFASLFGNQYGPDTHRHTVIPQLGEWPKLSSSLVLVRQTSNHAEIMSDLGLIRGLPYGRFARNLPTKILCELLAFPEVAEYFENCKYNVLVLLFTGTAVICFIYF
jgi:hypothetical protein